MELYNYSLESGR